ncbi:hypothetical protein LF63_0108165 [Oleiagrimonas soli]|nr:hypothetical protein LF63_0108165 [Oleiagrimonas soli]
MLAKLALILLVILFGASMFLAGAMAPDSWRQDIAGLVGKLPGLSPSDSSKSDAAGQAKRVAKSAIAPAASTAKASSAAKPATLGSLLVSTAVKQPEPKKGAAAYALQLGMYVSDAAAASEEKRVKAAGIDLPLTRIGVVDASGNAWVVLAVGRFPSTADAQKSEERIASILGMRNLSVVRLPDSGKPAS